MARGGIVNISRRDFVRSGGAMAALAMTGGGELLGAEPQAANGKSGLMWGALIHLSFNMWSDVPVDSWGNLEGDQIGWVTKDPKLRFDDELWVELTQHMSELGMNYILIDVGDGLQFESHPEISVEGAWGKERLAKELDRLRGLGLEPIPKMNFSAAHDTWLGVYSRMLSTPMYYEVCGDLIKETLELFGKPRLFHLGYDEETWGHQAKYDYVVVRQGETWWRDFLFFVEQVEKNDSRAWIWSDYYWHHPELFMSRMPKSVLQSNWYYSESFDPEQVAYVQAYLDLDKAGFEQIPTGSNWANATNFQGTVDFCTANLNPELLKGFMQTAWMPTLNASREAHWQAVDQVGAAIRKLATAKA